MRHFTFVRPASHYTVPLACLCPAILLSFLLATCMFANGCLTNAPACLSPAPAPTYSTTPPCMLPSCLPLHQAGVASTTLASAAVGATNVLGTMVAASLMDKAGRKQLLTNSFLGQVRTEGAGR